MLVQSDGESLDYLALAQKLIHASPFQRRCILQAVKLMGSKTARAALVIGSIAAVILIVVAAANMGVSPLLVWGLLISGGLMTIVIVLRILKIL